MNLVPKFPSGSSKLILLLPTYFVANPTATPFKLLAPCKYCVCSDVFAESCSTLISFCSESILFFKIV